MSEPTKRWRTMDSFVPPKIRPFNSDQDRDTWFWVSWGWDPILARFEPPGYFVPVAGGMIVGVNPKYWMPLEIPMTPEWENARLRHLEERQSTDGSPG